MCSGCMTVRRRDSSGGVRSVVVIVAFGGDGRSIGVNLNERKATLHPSGSY